MSDAPKPPAAPEAVRSEVESFSTDKLKHVETAAVDKESPVIAHIKMQKEIEKGPTGLKKTETHVKEVMPTAEDIKAEKEGK